VGDRRGWQALPVVERLKVAKPLAQQIRARTAEDVPVLVSGYDEASFHFYLDRGRIVPLSSSVAEWAAGAGPAVLVATQARLDAEPPLASSRIEIIARVEGINVANGASLRLVALGRDLPR
jgi:hypothetical protein